MNDYLRLHHQIAIVGNLANVLGFDDLLTAHSYHSEIEIKRVFNQNHASENITHLYFDLSTLIPVFIANGWQSADFVEELREN